MGLGIVLGALSAASTKQNFCTYSNCQLDGGCLLVYLFILFAYFLFCSAECSCRAEYVRAKTSTRLDSHGAVSVNEQAFLYSVCFFS